MTHLRTVQELHGQLVSSNPPVILDVRYGGPGSPGGFSAYKAGHIPGARYVDLDEVLAEPPSGGAGGRHPLPMPERFERGMRAVGVCMGKPVVLYDDWKSIAASRAWWLLRHFGHPEVSVLDGGWGAWDGERAVGAAPEIEVGDFQVGPGRLHAIDADGAATYAASGILLDARAEARFHGRDETIDPVAGHIPGAISFPALDLADPSGRMLSADELSARFRSAGVEGPGRGAAYCGSGVQAAYLALAAAVAGIDDDLALYAGSWSDWITDPSRPIA